MRALIHRILPAIIIVVMTAGCVGEGPRLLVLTTEVRYGATRTNDLVNG